MGRLKYPKVNSSTKSHMKGKKKFADLYYGDWLLVDMYEHLGKSFILVRVGNTTDLWRNNARRDFPPSFCGNSGHWPFTNYLFEFTCSEKQKS